MSSLMQLERRELQICDLSLQVHLGCSAKERKHPQEVRVSLKVSFDSPSLSERTDELKDSICYAQISQRLSETVNGRHFQLVEKMAAEFLKVLSPYCAGTFVELLVHKVNPPVEGLQGGVTYLCRESFV